MRTISQLAKIGRRIPRIKRNAMRALAALGTNDTGESLSVNQERKYLEFRLAGALRAEVLLKEELTRRNVFGPAFRDARTPRVRKDEAWAIVVQQSQYEIAGAEQRLAPYFPPPALVKRYEEKARIRR